MRDVQRIEALSRIVQQLSQKQQEQFMASRRLEQRIKQGEMEFGDLVQRYLKLQKGIETSKEHLNADKEALEKALVSERQMQEQIDSCKLQIRQISAAFEPTVQP